MQCWRFKSLRNSYWYVECVEGQWRSGGAVDAKNSAYEQAEENARTRARLGTKEEAIKALTYWTKGEKALLDFKDMPCSLYQRLFDTYRPIETKQPTEWTCRAPFNSGTCDTSNEVGYPCWRCGARHV